MNQFRAVVLDLDGTLFDTLPALAEAAREVLRAGGLRPVDDDWLRPALSSGLRPFFRRALSGQSSAIDVAVTQQLETRFLDRCSGARLPPAPLFDGAAELLARLYAGGTSLGICTNRDRTSAGMLLQRAGIAHLFDAVVGLGDSASPKPAAAPLLLACERLGVTPAYSLFVGDSAVDALCASEAGLRFAAHAGGYAEHPQALQPCVMLFSRYAQLDAWLRVVQPPRVANGA